VIVDRTKGEMSARCQGEASNFLALNLAHERVYGEAMKARREGRPPEIMQRLMFEIPRGPTGELDEAII
jgi:hypothetical protein